jgi:hypothetical protein
VIKLQGFNLSWHKILSVVTNVYGGFLRRLITAMSLYRLRTLRTVRELRRNQRVNLKVWIEGKVLLLTEYSNSIDRNKNKPKDFMKFVDRKGSQFNKF